MTVIGRDETRLHAERFELPREALRRREEVEVVIGFRASLIEPPPGAPLATKPLPPPWKVSQKVCSTSKIATGTASLGAVGRWYGMRAVFPRSMSAALDETLKSYWAAAGVN